MSDPDEIPRMHPTIESVIEIYHALSDIASGSPAISEPGTPRERSCPLCLAHIDHAREALGYEKWPAVPGTDAANHKNQGVK